MGDDPTLSRNQRARSLAKITVATGAARRHESESDGYLTDE